MKRKNTKDKFIRYMIQHLGGLYHNTLNDFSPKEKIEILDDQIKTSPTISRGIDYEESIINEAFIKHIDKFVKDFFYTSKRERAFNHHLGKYEQSLYNKIWEKNEEEKSKNGKYNLRGATFKVLRKEDQNLTSVDKEKCYDKVKHFMKNNQIKSFEDWKKFLGSIGSSLR